MDEIPEDSESPAARSWLLPAVILVVLAVGIGMYSLGRRSKAGISTAGQAATQPTGASATPVVTGRHFAPHDTFFLLDYVSARKASGVIGFEPGQKVHLVDVRPASQTLVVADDEAQVEVGPEKLTNDLDIADLARRKDQANQAKIATYLQDEKRAYDESQRAGAEKFEKALNKIDEQHQETARIAAAHTPFPGNSPATSKTGGEPVGTGTKLDEPPVEVGGGSGYGYSGSSYYGSPYSYFGGSTGSVSAPATGQSAPNPATVGAGRR